VLEEQPNSPLAELPGEPGCPCHGSILSRNRASGKPGAVQSCESAQLGAGPGRRSGAASASVTRPRRSHAEARTPRDRPSRRRHVLRPDAGAHLRGLGAGGPLRLRAASAALRTGRHLAVAMGHRAHLQAAARGAPGLLVPRLRSPPRLAATSSGSPTGSVSAWWMETSAIMQAVTPDRGFDGRLGGEEGSGGRPVMVVQAGSARERPISDRSGRSPEPTPRTAGDHR
jgi:hypothetical protein